MENKTLNEEFKTQLIVVLGILSLSSKEQAKSWTKVLIKDKGFLDRNLKYSLNRMNVISHDAGHILDFKGNVTEIERMVFKVKDRIMGRIAKGNEYVKGIPVELVDSYIEIKAAFLYVEKNLKKEVMENGLEREFKIIAKHAKRYINFFEKEMKGREKIFG